MRTNLSSAMLTLLLLQFAGLLADVQQKLKQSEDACTAATADAASASSQAGLLDRKAQMLARENQSLSCLLKSYDDESLMSGELSASADTKESRLVASRDNLEGFVVTSMVYSRCIPRSRTCSTAPSTPSAEPGCSASPCGRAGG